MPEAKEDPALLPKLLAVYALSQLEILNDESIQELRIGTNPRSLGPSGTEYQEIWKVEREVNNGIVVYLYFELYN